MLGVTTYLTTDVASAPFLWVLPLALYLTTFIIAFQAKPAIPFDMTLMFSAAAVAACASLLPFHDMFFGLQLLMHLGAFFFVALMCHQRLVSLRPDPAHLTEFYLCLSIGGVVGGGFNAFVAPVIFDNVWEYPIILALRAWRGLGRPQRSDLDLGAVRRGAIAAVADADRRDLRPPHLTHSPSSAPSTSASCSTAVKLLLTCA
jgi:hypothetical protein